MFGLLLTWMQEHKAPVFLAATANDIDSLPPELMRKGRFDEIFFVDLPCPDARREIFKIHLTKKKRDPAKFDIDKLVNASSGYTGAEIEQGIQGALHTAFGEKRDYLVLRLAYGDLTLMVPADNAEEIGLRDVINDEEVEEVFAVLRKKEARMPTNWSRRFKNHVEKLKSGDIYQVAEVVRNLSIRDKDKGLSAGEKRMLNRARQILVSELTFALRVDEETAEKKLDEALHALGQLDARQAKIVELRFFGGLSIAETAYVLKTSETTVRREWTFAKAWFQRELTRNI
jgi:CarD family transcriptional regulator